MQQTNNQSEYNKHRVQNATQMKEVLGKSFDVKFHPIVIGEDRKIQIEFIYIDGMVNFDYVSGYILKPLFQQQSFRDASDSEQIVNLIDKGDIYFLEQEKLTDMDKATNGILQGKLALLIEDQNIVFLFDVRGYEKRPITAPSVEMAIKGAKDSFVETLKVNMTLIRRRIHSKQLVIENIIIGEQTLTNVAMFYVEGVANANLVNQIRAKISSIKITGIFGPAFFEELIVTSDKYAFPQIMDTERPDKFCADIMEGRIGIIIDGFAMAYVLPTLFIQYLQSPDDYAYGPFIASFTRIMRYGLALIALLLPGLYISVTSFNTEMIPKNLTYAIANYRSGVTFPTFIETIIMLLAFEVLYEASNRMPNNIGQTVSIVGALIVGEAAVNAKLISPSVVIVLAVTAIANFSMPDIGFGNALRLWRLIISIMSSFLGYVGLVFSFIVLLFTLVKIENFGVPYMSPLVSTDGLDVQDTLLRPSPDTIKKTTKHKSFEQVTE